MQITNDVKYIGVNDYKIDLFEGQYQVPNGISYNSYLVLDEKNAVIDSVADGFFEEWISNIDSHLNGKSPDYLVIQHVEPDHSASALAFMRKYPECKIVSSVKAFSMLKAFFGDDYLDRRILVSDSDTLSLGKHILRFVTAPMVHWPEVIMSYDETDKILFSADAFGKFGVGFDGGWDDEARRYYIGIVGKYGAQVQSLFKKVGALNIKTICSLHGPVLTGDLSHYLSLYNTWSSYAVEKKGIVIAYTSIYGNTKAAATLLFEKIKENGYDGEVKIYDLARCDKAQAVADAFCYDTLVLASPTYNGELFPPMREYLSALVERDYKSRRVAFIENGSWAPMATRRMKQALEAQKDLTYLDPAVKITSALSDATAEDVSALANVICVK